MCVFLLVHMIMNVCAHTHTGVLVLVVLVCVLVLAWYRMLPAACCLLPVMGD